MLVSIRLSHAMKPFIYGGSGVAGMIDVGAGSIRIGEGEYKRGIGGRH